MLDTDLSAAPEDDPGLRAAVGHVRARTIVLPGLKLLFMPVPKAAWTSMLWELTGPAGLTAEDFRDSVKPEVSTTMMVHDEKVWGSRGLRLRDLDEERREEALTGDGWLRFTVVRDPGARLWSAWQSKFLLREPVYRGFHGEKDWYPRRPGSPEAALSDFRRFVAALRDGFDEEHRMRDPHWGRQTDVVGLLPLTHMGRIERLDETVELVRAHVQAHGGTPGTGPLRRENVTPLSYDPLVFDDRAAAQANELYAADLVAFGYEQIRPGSDPEARIRWDARFEDQKPQMRALVERHERLHLVVEAFRARERERAGRIARLRAERTEARAEVRRLKRRVTALNADKKALSATNRGMSRSLSWRITRPLRSVRRLLPRP